MAAGVADANTQVQIFQSWFSLADADKDGAIAGGEAVAFFQRSGLQVATLRQASGGGGAAGGLESAAAGLVEA